MSVTTGADVEEELLLVDAGDDKTGVADTMLGRADDEMELLEVADS